LELSVQISNIELDIESESNMWLVSIIIDEV